jgi:hypothetical protein
MRHAKIGLQMIMDHRAREDFNHFYQHAAKEDWMCRQRAEFESRTMGQFQTREIYRRAHKRKEQAEADVDARRSRLSELLRSEEAQFCSEIENVHETPAQRRVRLQAQLTAIQERQKEEHDEDVKRRLYNKWVEECDPLRDKISLAFERQVAKDRKQQLIDQDYERVKEDEEDARYVKTVYEGVREYKERVAQEEWDRRRKQRQNKATWIGQMDRRCETARREADKDMEEGMRFRRQNEADKIQAEKDAETRRRMLKERGRELNEMNREQMGYRRRAAEEELALDLKYLDQAKEELRKEGEQFIVGRLLAQTKARQNQLLGNAQSKVKKAADDEAEMYLQQAQEDANRRQDEVWRIDAEKRRKLMLDANQFQIWQMQQRQEGRERKKLAKIDEKREAEEQLATARRRDHEEAEQRAMMIRNQHQMLDTQVASKRHYLAMQKREEDDSVKALLSGWAEEERKIEEALKHPEDFLGKRWRGHR